nr:hypothetical protein [Halomonas socia]
MADRRRAGQAVQAEGGSLAPDLVQAIDDVGVVHRSFVEDEHGEKMARPMAMNFLGSKPMYLDDPAAVTKRLKAHWPELTSQQIARAMSMLGNRAARQREDRQTRIDLLKSGRRRRQGWMRDTESLMPWEL